MTGDHYRALVRLSSPDDRTLAEVGQTCERVPETSLPWLLAQGWIARIDQAASTDEPSAGGFLVGTDKD